MSNNLGSFLNLGQFSITNAWLDGYYGVCHADELIYLWEPVFSSLQDSNLGPLIGNDLLMREILLSAWTNFATYGDPTPPDSGFDWQPQQPNTQHLYWYISNENSNPSECNHFKDKITTRI